MVPPSAHATTVAARLDGVVALELAVTATSWVLPQLRELRLDGVPADFSALPGQDVMVSVPTDEGRSRWRRYTLRHCDPAAGTLTLWVTTDSGGPGARWALGAEPGDAAEAVGPRGKVVVDATARTHLFVVDAAGLAAMLAMAASIDAPATVHTVAVLEAAPDASVWDGLRRPGVGGTHRELHDTAGLVDAARAAVADADRSTTSAYVFCELSVMRAVAAELAAAGLDPSRVAAKPYWRAGQANQDHGEPDKS